MADPQVTPDGRYIVVRGRLWRRTNPDLPEEAVASLKSDLGKARAAVRAAKGAANPAALTQARAAVERAKVELGERGPVWWSDGARDWTRTLARNSPYARWYASVE